MTGRTLPPWLRQGLLSAVFGISALQAPLAQAAEQAPPQTAAAQDLHKMRAHYDRLRRDDAPIAVYSADDAETPNSYDAWDNLPDALEKQGVLLEDDGIDQIEPYFNFGEGPFDGAGIGLDAEIIMPQAVLQVSTAGAGKACVVLAATPDIMPFDLPAGLSPEMAARYVNRHEFWHCLDSTMPDQHAPSPVTNGELDAVQYKFLQNVLRTETFADLNAAADLIALDGADRTVIDHLASWRTAALASRMDLHHDTAPALQALGREIDGMGIKQFRSLSDGQRERLVKRVAAAHTPTAAAMALGVHLTLDLDMPEELAPSDADRAYAENMAARYKKAKAAATPARTRAAGAVFQPAIEAFDARAALTSVAGTDSPTHLQLLAARAELLDGLRRDINADPANPVHAGKILRLGRAYKALLTAPATPAVAPAPVVMAAIAAPPAAGN